MVTNSCKNFHPCHKVCHRMTPNRYRKIFTITQIPVSCGGGPLTPTWLHPPALRGCSIGEDTAFFPAGNSIWGFDCCNDRFGHKSMH